MPLCNGKDAGNPFAQGWRTCVRGTKLVNAVFAGQTYNLVNVVVILASNETKTSGHVMPLEL